MLDVRNWDVRGVTSAATRAAVIKGAADMPTRSPFMLRQDAVHSEHFRVVTASRAVSAFLLAARSSLSRLAGRIVGCKDAPLEFPEGGERNMLFAFD